MNLQYEFSYSQVDAYERCPRKWGHQWLDGLERPKSKFAEFGIRAHGIIRDWLRERRMRWDEPESKVAASIAQYLPPPQAVDPMNVEREVGLVIGGERFVLVLDLYQPGDVPVVYDHKTTSDFGWALTSGAMADDIQATLYAAWAFIESRASRVKVQWTYGRTRGAVAAMRVVVTLTGREIQPRLEKTIRSAREMRAILEANHERRISALELPFNPGECEAFGGCPFRDVCNLKPEQVMESIMSQGSARENFLQKLKERGNGQVVPQPVNPPAEAAPAPTGGGLAAKIAARKAAPPAAPEPEPEPVEEAAPARGRGPGRPKKETSAGDLWAGFAAAALPAVASAGLSVGEVDAPGAAELAAQFADEMLKKHAERF